MFHENDKSLVSNRPGKDDLENSLIWAARIVESGRSLLGELAPAVSSSRSTPVTGLARFTARNPFVDEKSSVNLPSWETENKTERDIFISPTSGQDGHSRGPLDSRHDKIRSLSDDRTRHSTQSPQGRRSPRGSLPGNLQSSLFSRPKLPSHSSQDSPSSTKQQNPFAPPGHTSSAHNAHVQDLQHQVSTKTLALQTLQREHDSLLAAFSRHQTSYSTLDKKTKVADVEIKELTEEKISLQSQVDSLESQVEELSKNKEDAHQQSVSSGAQYMKIMAMSSRLQAQSASDQKKWKAEKQEWETEKEKLLKRIESLEMGNENVKDSAQLQSTLPGVPSDGSSETNLPDRTFHFSNDLESMAPDALRSEIISLRQRCHEMETVLKELVQETESLNEVIQELTCVSGRISQKIRPEFQAQQTSQSPNQPKEQTGHATEPGL
ncbi:hypothetical protein FQN54_008255 [Arachnomyces sp. PD_36]|nr:hypothetical protein FQN54_008255 [Arachnomyces sp. PD_36]